jgi:hypothetical protein
MLSLQGTALSPGDVTHTPDRTELRTLQGELASRLGTAKDYAMIAEDDLVGKRGLPAGSLAG